MKLALVKLQTGKGDSVEEFLEYVSLDVAKLDVFINGFKNKDDEWSKPIIIRIYK